jgi:hypothetical protein
MGPRQCPKIILQELHVGLEDPVNVLWRPDLIFEAQPPCVRLARRAPPTTTVELISVPGLLSQLTEILFGLAFYPPGAICSDGEVISGMQHSDLLAGEGLVLKLDRRGLVVILQAGGIVLHHVNFCELNPMTLDWMVTPILLLGYRTHTLRRPPPTRRAGSDARI